VSGDPLIETADDDAKVGCLLASFGEVASLLSGVSADDAGDGRAVLIEPPDGVPRSLELRAVVESRTTRIGAVLRATGADTRASGAHEARR
jgi:hypothetical protein